MSLCVLPSRVSVSAQSWQRVASVDQVKPVTVTSFLPSALQSASHFHSHHCIFLNTHSSISKSATFFCTHFIHSFSHDTVFLCNVFFSPLLTRSSDNSLHCVRLVCVSFPLVSTRFLFVSARQIHFASATAPSLTVCWTRSLVLSRRNYPKRRYDRLIDPQPGQLYASPRVINEPAHFATLGLSLSL